MLSSSIFFLSFSLSRSFLLYFFLLLSFAPPPTPIEAVAVGRPAQDQRVVLGVGEHGALHQHLAAVAGRRAQRLWLLRLPGAERQHGPQGQRLHRQHGRPHLREARR